MQQPQHSIVVALGSNYEQETNISKAVQCLERLLADTRRSRQLWTMPIGIRSDRFLNVILSGKTPLTLEQLRGVTKAIERDMGRSDGERQCGTVRIDIDIILYDGIRLHTADWQRDYIKTLYKDISE